MERFSQFSSVTQSYLILCYPMDCSTPGFSVHHQLLQLAQTHTHQVGDAITISSSVVPFYCSQSFPASGSFPMSQLCIYAQEWDCRVIVIVQLLSRVQLFATPWTAARQASLFITNSQSLLQLMSIKLVMPSNHLILCSLVTV